MSQKEDTEQNISQGERQQQLEFAEVVGTSLAVVHPLSSHIDPMYEESIRSFLKRPYPIARGTWTGSQGFGAIIDGVSLMAEYLYTTSRIREKLTGFTYLRGDMRVSLRVNGTRFHYGMLVMAFYPLENMIGAGNQHLRVNVKSAMMMPSIFVSPNSDGVEELQVPFAYPDQYINITGSVTDINDFGYIRLFVLDPLKAVNQTTVGQVDWTMYAHFVDPVVTGFTPLDLAVVPTVAGVEVQGYTGEDATRVVPEFLNGFNTDGGDPSVSAGMVGYPMGSSNSTELVFKPSDMELKTLYTYPNPVAVFNWSSDYLPGDRIGQIPVAPLWNQAYSSLPSYIPTYLTTISSLFQYWRGALRYRLLVVASGFHSGRLMITWNPTRGVPSAKPVPDLANANHLILDIQQTTEIYFTVPYLHHVPWQLTTNLEDAANIQFNILNSLTTPSGDTSTVSVFMWVYGSDTLEFAMPRLSAVNAFTPPPSTDRKSVV